MVSLKLGTIILSIASGIAWGLPFFLTFYMLADIPAPQVLSVWRRTLNMNKKPFFDASKLFGASEKSSEQKEIEREKYLVFCSRLDKKVSYEELQDQGKKIATTFIVIGFSLAIGQMFIGASPSIMISLFIVIIFLGIGLVGSRMPFMQIEKEIKKLDQAVIFETPIFINNVKVMNTKYTLEKVIEMYLEMSGPITQDLKLTLASLKNKTNVKALIEMANRMQRGQRLEEISSMIDLMKSLYSGTDVERCCINMELLANQINELHVKPFIEKEKSKKMMVMQMCVIGVVMFVFLLYISPMIIEMSITLGEINS